MDMLLALLAEEFWSIILVIVLIANKRYRIGGVMLIALRAINGAFYWWTTTAIMIFIIFKSLWWDPAIVRSSNESQHQVRKDPDQQPRR